jgi:transcriptional regulator of arginine metabolism
LKSKRQNAILKIIASRDIETQNQLIEALSEAGVESTQATISRDIKELHLIKS